MALHLCQVPVALGSLGPAGVVCVGSYALHLQQVWAPHAQGLGRVDCVGFVALFYPLQRKSQGMAVGQSMPLALVGAGKAAGCCSLRLYPPLGWYSVSAAADEPHWDMKVQLGHSAPAALLPCNQRLLCIFVIIVSGPCLGLCSRSGWGEMPLQALAEAVGGRCPATALHSGSSTSDQVGIPAELKHINKRRKRNQQGLPQ